MPKIVLKIIQERVERPNRSNFIGKNNRFSTDFIYPTGPFYKIATKPTGRIENVSPDSKLLVAITRRICNLTGEKDKRENKIMAKLMSKKTKEIVQTVAVIVIVLLLVGFYVIYPLLTVSKMVMRPDKDKFNDPEFAYPNNDSFFIDSGLTPDTFAISTDDNIRLAALYFYPDTTAVDSITGTVILIHSDNKDRTTLLPYIRPLLQAGLAVIIYDQRGTGYSGGKFRTAGIYESDDLLQLIVDLNFHEKIHPPLTVAGFGVGADAAIFSAQKDKRINGVVAVDPYLTSTRWLTTLTKRYHLLAIPLYKMVYFWWYQKLTGFPFGRTGIDDIKPIETKTILIASPAELEEPEYQRLIELSPETVTTVSQAADSDSEQSRKLILEYILYTAGIPTANLK